jgi:hypothetical protein
MVTPGGMPVLVEDGTLLSRRKIEQGINIPSISSFGTQRRERNQVNEALW